MFGVSSVPNIFYRSVIWHTPPDLYQSQSAVTSQARSHWVMSLLIFYQTEVSTQDLIFIEDKLFDGNVRFFIRSKVGAHNPIFTPMFCL